MQLHQNKKSTRAVGGYLDPSFTGYSIPLIDMFVSYLLATFGDIARQLLGESRKVESRNCDKAALWTDEEVTNPKCRQ